MSKPKSGASSNNMSEILKRWTTQLPATVGSLDFLERFWFAIGSGLGLGIGFGAILWLCSGDGERAAEWGRYITLYVTGVGALVVAALRVDWTRKNDARVQNERAWEFAAKTYIDWKICISEYSNAIDDLESLLTKLLFVDYRGVAIGESIVLSRKQSTLNSLAHSLQLTYKNARVKYEILHLSVLPVDESLYVIAINIQNKLYELRNLQSLLCSYLLSDDTSIRARAKYNPNEMHDIMLKIHDNMMVYERHHVTQRGKALSF